MLLPLAADAVELRPMIFGGVEIEQLEYRTDGSGLEILAWDADAAIGTDDLAFVLRSKAEFDFAPDRFEELENQLRLQTPVSFFFDAVAGVRFDTPDDYERVDGVVGLHGLAEQWFEIDLDLFVSDNPSLRFEVEYEALLTNYWILTPRLELDLPFTDDRTRNYRAWAPVLEAGLRLSHDLVQRTISPYIGVHYETSFGETADRAREEGDGRETLMFVAGVRLFF